MPWITGGLSPKQIGFRHGTGAADAIDAILNIAKDAAKGVVRDKHLCVLVTHDVRNVFNSAPWCLIDVAVAGFGVPQYMRQLVRSYLSERIIIVPVARGNIERSMTCGVS